MAIRKTYPQRFGKYILLAPLAKGGMGELHLAYSGRLELKKLCVIKTILGHLADEEFTNRFIDEAKVVVKLSHGNLVPAFEAGEVDGQFYVVLEFINGKDLREVWNWLESEGRTCPLDVALFIAREICKGLHYVHTYEELELVHRDISPPNVLLSYSGEVRLTDFGVATSTIKLQKTAPGILLGKLSYMSPEQARNEGVDPRADIYSVGVILWELITGQRLFPPGSSLVERFQRATNPVIVPPSTIRKDLPPALDLIVLRALAIQPSNRYADAEAFRRDLASELAKLSPTTDSASVQTLLKELFGDLISHEQRERQAHLDSMTEAIKALSEESVGRATTQPAMDLSVTSLGGDLDRLPSMPAPSEPTSSASVPILPEGMLLGDRYRIMELIGEGGMGTVYLATHVDIEKQVAVKVLHPIFSSMPDVILRFRQEAKAASRIGHPNIVEVFDSGTTADGCLYFVMEKLSGIDLADVLDVEGRLAIPRSIKIMSQVCEAVAAAHEVGIIHRDLKPENIYLTIREGEPDFAKVLDFGIAKTTDLDDNQADSLTNPGIAMGTPEYMAPEQAEGKDSDHRVDIYAAGALLYEIIVGEPPHAGDTILEVLNRKASEPIVPPSQRREGVSEALEKLILWSLQDNPDDRPQTMSQMCYELNKLIHGRAGAVASLLGIPAPVTPEPPPLLISRTEQVPVYDPDTPSQAEHQVKQTRIIWVIAAIGLVVAGGLGATLIFKPKAPNPTRAVARVADQGPLPTPPDQTLARAPTDATVPSDLGETREAAQAARVVKKKPARSAAQSYLRVGRQHLMAGRFPAARLAFEGANRSSKHAGQAQLGLAEVAFQLGQYHEALDRAKVAVSKGVGYRGKLVLGNAYFKLRNFKMAIKMYRAVLALKPNHKEANRNMDAAIRRLQNQ